MHIMNFIQVGQMDMEFLEVGVTEVVSKLEKR